jgi:phosphatidate cytidylyltransferase
MTFNLNRFNNLGQRIIVGLIGVLIIFSAIIWSPWGYFALFFAIFIITLIEFYQLVWMDGSDPLSIYGIFCGILIYSLPFLIGMKIMSNNAYLLIFPAIAFIFIAMLYNKSNPKPFSNIAYTVLGVIYIVVPMSLLHIIAFSSGEFSYEIVIGILLMTWSADTGAYFVGSKFGRTKLFERISPKKSWEGFLGGALFTMGMAIGLSYVFDVLPWWKWIVAGVLIVVAGTYGDLVESLFKREINIKDSGTILPGHGGFLDRFDALLLSLPFIAAFLILSG